MATRFLQNALLAFYSKKIVAILSVEVDTKIFLNNDFLTKKFEYFARPVNFIAIF